MKRFKAGDRVRMRCGLHGAMFGQWIHGKVEDWPTGGPGGLLVRWNELPTVTSLPNTNVELDTDPN